MTLRYASSVVGYPMRLLGRNHFPEPAGGIQDGWGGGGGGRGLLNTHQMHADTRQSK